jgi:hypothetical protein
MSCLTLQERKVFASDGFTVCVPRDGAKWIMELFMKICEVFCRESVFV